MDNTIRINQTALKNLVSESLVRIIEGNIIRQLGINKEEAEKKLRQATRKHFNGEKSMDWVEMAEHETHIVVDAFGDEFDDEWLDDDNYLWFMGIIRDEFIKMGGTYDTMDDDGHVKMLKKKVLEALGRLTSKA